MQIKEVIRISEGSSYEDFEDGNAFEIVYCVYDEGEIIMETTDKKFIRECYGI